MKDEKIITIPAELIGGSEEDQDFSITLDCIIKK